jgi:DNA-directed RNA polymerase subunit F
MKFIDDFSKIDPDDAEKLGNSLEGLGIMKLRREHIAKIVDTLPENQEELNKVLTSVSLSEDESTKVLDSVKKFK